MIKTKRINKRMDKDDGLRILVERTWPRGLAESDEKVDLWLPELAPSDSLRSWFSHDPKKWETFRERYQSELSEKEEVVQKLKDLEEENGTITLLYASKNEKFNDAVVLQGIFAEEYQV